MEKGGFFYILTNQRHTVLYSGSTVDLQSRISEHKKNSFTERYNIDKLVYFESFSTIDEAIEREKQIKGASRKKKEELITKTNSDWKDLYPEILEW